MYKFCITVIITPKKESRTTMKNLTQFGIENPVLLMETLHNIGKKDLVNLVKNFYPPEIRKQLRTWGIKDAAEMIGKSRSSIKAFEIKKEIPTAPRDEKGKKQYSLELINTIRDTLGTRFKKPSHLDPIVCCTLNFKRRSGKSITSLLLSQYLAIQGLKVLGIDLDPQATFTSWFGYIPDIDFSKNHTIRTILLENNYDIENVITKTYFTGIDIIPSNLELEESELALPYCSDQQLLGGNPLKKLDKALNKVKNNYDVIIIDCPPRTGALTMNAISAANAALISLPPSISDFASFIKLTKILQNIFKATKPDHLDFFRILLTKHKGDSNANRVDQLIRKLSGEYTLVNHMVDFAEIDNNVSTLASIYEKPYVTNSLIYKRALATCNKASNEIFSAFKEIWSANKNTF